MLNKRTYKEFEATKESDITAWWFTDNQEELLDTYKRRANKNFSNNYIWLIHLQVYIGRKILKRFETWKIK